MTNALAGRIVFGVLLIALALTLTLGPNQTRSLASSRREAPLIVADPLADNTDTYAFRSTETGRSGFVTIIANWIPFYLTPPNNIGERTTPNYETALAQPAVYPLLNGGKVFAGQRDEGFYIDGGGVFDTLKLKSIGATDGVDSTAGFNVSTIAIEVPIREIARVSRGTTRNWGTNS